MAYCHLDVKPHRLSQQSESWKPQSSGVPRKHLCHNKTYLRFKQDTVTPLHSKSMGSFSASLNSTPLKNQLQWGTGILYLPRQASQQITKYHCTKWRFPKAALAAKKAGTHRLSELLCSTTFSITNLQLLRYCNRASSFISFATRCTWWGVASVRCNQANPTQV